MLQCCTWDGWTVVILPAAPTPHRSPSPYALGTGMVPVRRTRENAAWAIPSRPWQSAPFPQADRSQAARKSLSPLANVCWACPFSVHPFLAGRVAVRQLPVPAISTLETSMPSPPCHGFPVAAWDVLFVHSSRPISSTPKSMPISIRLGIPNDPALAPVTSCRMIAKQTVPVSIWHPTGVDPQPARRYYFVR